MRTMIAIVAAAALAACATDTLAPAPLQTGTSCGYCRMTVLDAKLASQIVARGEEPIFFDDLHCLASYLRLRDRTRPLGEVYVADHRTGAWVHAEEAVYGSDGGRATPMSSGLVAYRDEASRAGENRGGAFRALTARDVFGDRDGDVFGR